MTAKTFFISGPSGCRYVKGLADTTQEMVDYAVEELTKECPDGEHEFSVTEVLPPMPVNVGRRIVCAANLYQGRTILGIRHFDAIMHAQYRSATKREPTIQGFIDNRGNFLTREESWVVAMAAQQIIRRVGGDEGRLFSENLY